LTTDPPTYRPLFLEELPGRTWNSHIWATDRPIQFQFSYGMGLR